LAHGRRRGRHPDDEDELLPDRPPDVGTDLGFMKKIFACSSRHNRFKRRPAQRRSCKQPRGIKSRQR
jgi:hypothetical protein